MDNKVLSEFAGFSTWILLSNHGIYRCFFFSYHHLLSSAN